MPRPRPPRAPRPSSCQHRRERRSCPSSRPSTRRFSRGPSPSISARRRIRKAPWPTGPISPAPSRSRGASTSSSSPTNAIRRSMATTRLRRARDGLCRDREPRQCGGVPVAVQALGPAGLEVGLRRRRSGVHRAFGRFRNVACPQVPLPVQHVSAEAWADEGHVERTGALPREFRHRRRHSQGRYGYRRPPGGFFLWLIWRLSGAGRRPRKPFGKGVVSECCRELISRRAKWRQSGHGLHQGRARARRGRHDREA